MFRTINNWFIKRKVRRAGLKLCGRAFDEVCELDLEGQKPQTLLEIFREANDPEVKAKIQIQILLQKGQEEEKAITVRSDKTHA